jgi:hypothetical protein
MLRSTAAFWDYRISATDGVLGKIKDLLFDDRAWITRYLVADTSAWLPGRKVLIVPPALSEPDWMNRELPVPLSRRQVKDSPDVEEDQPVSRQREERLHRYYGWTPYWPGPEAAALAPDAMRSPEPGSGEALADDDGGDGNGDPRLRSVKEVTGYGIAALDGEIGHVEEFIIDDETWWLRYAVVDTRNWLPGRKVLVSPLWIQRIDWASRSVEINLSRARIENSPPYDPTEAVNRQYEERLYDYYGQPRYWR